MEECKCGRIPPCYGGKKFRIHEELEKMPRVALLSEEAAQEMIKTLEDFSKSLEAELKACELMNLICEDIEKSIKSNDMEEKKTKKMTKAEAFEWLKHKKVAIVGDSRAIQNKLFNIGYKWCDGSTVAISMVNFLFIDEETFQFTESLSHFKNYAYEEISADDILSIEIIDDEPLDKWDEFARCVAKVQEKIEDDEVCIITKGKFLTMTK